MLKKRFLLISFVISLLISCENINGVGNKDLVFGLGNEAVNEIILVAGPVVKKDSLIRVDCQIKDLNKSLQSKSVKLENLYDVEFKLENLILGQKIQIEIKIYLDNKVIYEGLSDPIRITGLYSDVCSIELKLHKSKITYIDSQGKEMLVEEYTITDNHKINPGKKLGYRLEGWYYDKECTAGKKVLATEFGKNNYAGDITLYGKWVLCEEVPVITAETGDTKVILKWEEPGNPEFAKVVISYDNNKSVEVGMGAVSKEINNLKNGTKYDFKIQTVDVNGNMSFGKNISQYAMFGLTEVPEQLTSYNSPCDPAGGIKTGEGGKWAYVKFGDWPQTMLPEKDVSKIITCPNDTVNINGTNGNNGWNCYYGNDGYYYVKVKSTPFFVAGSHNDPANPNTIYKFSNGDVVEKDKEYYFKVEPIKWRVLSNDYVDGAGSHTGKLLLAENALMPSAFYKDFVERTIEQKTIYPNNYKHSDIRSLINEEVLNKAFTSKARNNISDTTVDNRETSTFGTGESAAANTYACEQTKDKIILLSVAEATDADYGFDRFDVEDKNRIRRPIDYGKAVGMKVEDGGCYWFLRSPGNYNKVKVRLTSIRGRPRYCTNVNDVVDIVPALTIKF